MQQEEAQREPHAQGLHRESAEPRCYIERQAQQQRPQPVVCKGRAATERAQQHDAQEPCNPEPSLGLKRSPKRE